LFTPAYSCLTAITYIIRSIFLTSAPTCKPPRGKKQRAMYSKYHKQQTWGVRNELIAKGVLNK